MVPVVARAFAIGKTTTHSSDGAPSVPGIKAGLAGFPLFEIDGGGGREGGEEKQTEETVHGG